MRSETAPGTCPRALWQAVASPEPRRWGPAWRKENKSRNGPSCCSRSRGAALTCSHVLRLCGRMPTAPGESLESTL